MTPAVDALLFDLGGVLVDVDLRRTFAAWAAAAGTDADTIAQRWEFGDAHTAYERGEVPFSTYCDHLRGLLQVDLSDERLHKGWMALIGEPIAGMRELLASLSGRFPLYVLSNNNPEHYAYQVEHFADLLWPFGRVFCSHEIGVCKPDRDAFERVAREIGVPLQRIAFFDDFEPNVTGARAAGLEAFHVANTPDVIRALATVGISPDDA